MAPRLPQPSPTPASAEPHACLSPAPRLPHPSPTSASPQPHAFLNPAPRLPKPSPRLPHPSPTSASPQPHACLSPAPRLPQPSPTPASAQPHACLTPAPRLPHPSPTPASPQPHSCLTTAPRLLLAAVCEGRYRAGVYPGPRVTLPPLTPQLLPTPPYQCLIPAQAHTPHPSLPRRLKMMTEMTRYKQQTDMDDDSSSIGSARTEELPTGTTTIRYHLGSHWWRSRTVLEKCLLVACLVLVVLMMAMTAILHFKTRPMSIMLSDHTGSSQLCLTPDCVIVSGAVLSNMNLSVDPCENFYEYACGGWVAKNPIPEGKPMWGTLSKMTADNNIILRRVLESNNTLKSEAEGKARIFYESCIDANKTIEKLGPKPVLKMIKQMGGWSVSGNWSAVNYNLTRDVINSKIKFLSGALFSWRVSVDYKNSSSNVLLFDEGGLGLPARNYYLNESDTEVVDAYVEYITQVGVLLGGAENASREAAQGIVGLEHRLSTISTPDDQRRDDNELYNPMTINDLTMLAPFMDWKTFINTAFMEVNIVLDGSRKIVVYAPDYLKNLTDILNDTIKTKQGIIDLHNYLVWQVVQNYVDFLSQDFQEAAKVLEKALMGVTGADEVWRECVMQTNIALGKPVGAMFVREAFSKNLKDMAEDMIDRVRNSFKDSLLSVTWMDEETQKKAIEKADAIFEMIGFPDYILNADELDKEFARLKIIENDYFQNNKKIREFTKRKEYARINKPVNKTRWDMSPPTVNAYYSPSRNDIVFPAGILQAPFFDARNPKALNYGTVGVVMGHELVHAFDDQGRKYDKDGNLHSWWRNETAEKFNKLSHCFEDQYSAYEFVGEHLKGKLTLGENIADNGGLKASFQAYKKWLRDNGPEEALPGIMSNYQLFFLGFAQVWCSDACVEVLVCLQVWCSDACVEVLVCLQVWCSDACVEVLVWCSDACVEVLVCLQVWCSDACVEVLVCLQVWCSDACVEVLVCLQVWCSDACVEVWVCLQVWCSDACVEVWVCLQVWCSDACVEVWVCLQVWCSDACVEVLVCLQVWCSDACVEVLVCLQVWCSDACVEVLVCLQVWCSDACVQVLVCLQVWCSDACVEVLVCLQVWCSDACVEVLVCLQVWCSDACVEVLVCLQVWCSDACVEVLVCLQVWCSDACVEVLVCLQVWCSDACVEVLVCLQVWCSDACVEVLVCLQVWCSDACVEVLVCLQVWCSDACVEVLVCLQVWCSDACVEVLVCLQVWCSDACVEVLVCLQVWCSDACVEVLVYLQVWCSDACVEVLVCLQVWCSDACVEVLMCLQVWCSDACVEVLVCLQVWCSDACVEVLVCLQVWCSDACVQVLVCLQVWCSDACVEVLVCLQVWCSDACVQVLVCLQVWCSDACVEVLVYLQVWCSSITREAAHLEILKDSHVPGEFRVFGSLTNSEDFGKAFSCDKGSKMNPEKKCKVW
ncbi:Endothelin-converting enzyme [Chionoecetes opilio]|uniref:Endothelin-converting enzyme n=1 Tax=Chionoecetes opilio TaxID=41210 RepID=A0A8J4XP77_CHIOP|nr:Endothelin-converting enzyme [Chionoecetes opilio]